ncbi:MAG: hypothetical protein DWQ05_08620 [Calditrichaeota bacterium]|nr:MAG: hypothetical protein DWQ05_08620 [Calditrichota bacterium]
MKLTLWRLLKNKWREYLLEVTVIAVGITLSFLLNEFREGRLQKKAEIAALQSIRDDMIADSTKLFEGLQYFERCDTLNSYLVKSRNGNNINTDSVQIAVTNFGSYTTFDAQIIGYQQLKETGLLNIIFKKPLLKALIQLYSSQYQNIKEIESIDKKYTLDMIIPQFFEIIITDGDSLFTGSENARLQAAAKILTDLPFQKALFMNRQLKLLGKNAYLEVLPDLRRLISQVENELQYLE